MSEKTNTCILVSDIASSSAFSDTCRKKLLSAFSAEEISLSAKPEMDTPEITAVRGAWIDILEKKINSLKDSGKPCHLIGIGTGALLALNACMYARPHKLCLINAPLIGVSTTRDKWKIFRERGRNPDLAVMLSESRALCLESTDIIREVSCPTLIMQTTKTANQHVESSNYLMHQLGTGQWFVEKQFFALPKKKKQAFSDNEWSDFIKTISNFFAS